MSTKKSIPAPAIERAITAKYRPRRIADLAGQSVLKATLTSALERGMVAAAYLFTGPAGTGKTSTARILAASLNCEEGSGPEPCGVCGNCRQIPLGDHPDILEIDAASNGGIDQIRQLIEFVATRAIRARTKVVVIDECHQLSTAASNALLKTLEEPPAGVVFVLATTERNAVLETIRSRCQELSFRPLSTDEVQANLKGICEEEGIVITETALAELARASHGGLRDAQSLLGQLRVLGRAIATEDVWEQASAIPEPLKHSLLGNLLKGDLLSALEDAREMLSRGHQVDEVLAGLRGGVRDVMLMQLVPAADGRLEATAAGKHRITALAGRRSYPELQVIAEVVARGMQANHNRALRGATLLDLVIMEASQAQPVAPSVVAAPVVTARVVVAEEASEEPACALAPAPASPPAAPVGPDAWASLLSKLPAGRVREKLEAATFLNLSDSELVVVGPASLAALAPAAGKALSAVLGRPIKLVRRAE
ncbi:DNA polymerase III subunit gamma/tau [Cyanobium sp. WKJ7-Wakatipu]|uniref:DNA polymerase III subunit gamma/tau n=1 Tax=Cyanobium sp. WKJ7-Wakatipu TaxID=2823726 RepID=UPI0020CC2320|nr:DNA polymerase III subunit gamma/tau [Cyanobium sp. WKJ7-Wakatipu]MCP9784039.1 DNA polymerase III subunit gamma/tau [Cyanobium sp. WKJ7-Wakatipu]